ncbi:MAG: hypothetical protein V1815_02900 [Candidatus Woesearchaeota archaeon]
MEQSIKESLEKNLDCYVLKEFEKALVIVSSDGSAKNMKFVYGKDYNDPSTLHIIPLSDLIKLSHTIIYLKFVNIGTAHCGYKFPGKIKILDKKNFDDFVKISKKEYKDLKNLIRVVESELKNARHKRLDSKTKTEQEIYPC